MINEPVWTHNAKEIVGKAWILMHNDDGPCFATFNKYSELLAWHEDGQVSYGEEGKSFSDHIYCLCMPFEQIELEAEAEQDMNDYEIEPQHEGE